MGSGNGSSPTASAAAMTGTTPTDFTQRGYPFKQLLHAGCGVLLRGEGRLLDRRPPRGAYKHPGINTDKGSILPAHGEMQREPKPHVIEQVLIPYIRTFGVAIVRELCSH